MSDEAKRIIARLNGHRQASSERGFHSSALHSKDAIDFIEAQAARIERLETALSGAERAVSLLEKIAGDRSGVRDAIRQYRSWMKP